MAGVRPMPSKLAIETMMPKPVICSCRYGIRKAMPTTQTNAARYLLP